MVLLAITACKSPQYALVQYLIYKIGEDIITTPATISFPEMSSSGSIQCTTFDIIVDDDLVEGEETFVISKLFGGQSFLFLTSITVFIHMHMQWLFSGSRQLPFSFWKQ